MKQQSETFELCPALGKWLCVCPRGEQSLFNASCHYSLSWILFPVRSGFVLWMLWSSVCVLIPQGCPGRQLSRWAPSWVFLWQELPREQQCRCCAELQDQTSSSFSGEEGGGQHAGKRQPEEEMRNGETAAVICV